MKINGEVEGNVPHITQTRMPRTRREAEHSRGLLRAACRRTGTLPDCLNNRSEYPSFRGCVPAHRSFRNRRGANAKPARLRDCASPSFHRRLEGPRLTCRGIGREFFTIC